MEGYFPIISSENGGRKNQTRKQVFSTVGGWTKTLHPGKRGCTLTNVRVAKDRSTVRAIIGSCQVPKFLKIFAAKIITEPPG
jgi:hypothetical protein